MSYFGRFVQGCQWAFATGTREWMLLYFGTFPVVAWPPGKNLPWLFFLVSLIAAACRNGKHRIVAFTIASLISIGALLAPLDVAFRTGEPRCIRLVPVIYQHNTRAKIRQLATIGMTENEDFVVYWWSPLYLEAKWCLLVRI